MNNFSGPLLCLEYSTGQSILKHLDPRNLVGNRYDILVEGIGTRYQHQNWPFVR